MPWSLEIDAKQHSSQHGVRFPGLVVPEWNQSTQGDTIGMWSFRPRCVRSSCGRPIATPAPRSLEKLSFASSKTHARILTLQRFQEPLFTPAPESTPWKETQAVKKHTSNKAKEFQVSLKTASVWKTTAHLFRRYPQSRRVNKTQYLLGL